MNRLEQIISNKCDDAGCSAEQERRHHRLFIHEHWDVHPPPNFLKWAASDHTRATCNPITLWNAQSARQEYRSWHAGTPEESF